MIHLRQPTESFLVHYHNATMVYRFFAPTTRPWKIRYTHFIPRNFGPHLINKSVRQTEKVHTAERPEVY